MGGFEGPVPAAVGLRVVGGLPLLRPAEQVFAAMLEGWRNQQLARNLAFTTAEGRERTVKAFAGHVNAFPWQWTSQMVDEWLGDLRSVRHLKRSTLRGYQEALHSFCHYGTDPAYVWAAECEHRFGTHPVQVVHEWNTAVSRSRPRKHDVDLHLRVLGLPHSHVAPGAGCHGRGGVGHQDGAVKRQVRYRWRLREVMAAQGMFTTTELVPPLRERGIDLSASQVHRLVTGTPERLSLPVLAALCDIFEATPAELIVTAADNVGVRKTGTGDAPVTPAAAKLRPTRARIRPEG